MTLNSQFFSIVFKQIGLGPRKEYLAIFIRCAHSDNLCVGVLIPVDVLDVVLLVLEDRILFVTLHPDTHVGRLAAGARILTHVGGDHLEWLKRNEYRIRFRIPSSEG